MSVKIPAQYQSYVDKAAKDTGLPRDIIAAQIQTESSWNPDAVSPAGAEGIAQFEPGTYASYGPKGGSPYNVADAFAAYTAYMKALLKQEGGSIRNALAAYNAGPGNLSAGYGYADSIMRLSGSGTTTVSGSSGSSSDGILSWPTEMLGYWTTYTNALNSATEFAAAFFRPSTYIRISAGFFGIVFLIFGIIALAMGAAKEK